jgi:cis-3-alkyl-4-acyloxetan-2-one decarboxylase
VSDWRKLYPFESHELELDGQRYHYLDEGFGPVLLLAHGNPTWSFYWRRLVLALRDRYRLIVPDHIGCGLSSKPAEYEYRLARHVANLVRLVDSLDLSDVTLIAHDWGGAIGLGAAIARRERFARLVLMNTAGFRSRKIPLWIRICRTPILGRLVVQGLNAFVRAALWMATEYPARLSPEVRAGLIAPYDTWAHRRAVYEFVRDIPLSPRHPSYAKLAEIEAGLASLADRPTLLVWGMRDWCFTSHFLERFLDFFPAAEVRRLDAAGHYVVEDAPEEVIDAIEEFLAKHPLGVSAR